LEGELYTGKEAYYRLRRQALRGFNPKGGGFWQSISWNWQFWDATIDLYVQSRQLKITGL
jgi:hypothetical protein